MTEKNFSDLKKKSKFIKTKAKELGFDACGIAKADKLYKYEKQFLFWVENSYHGSMKYFERNKEKRLVPNKTQKNTKSIIVVALNYYNENYSDYLNKNLKIARYAATTKSYHKVIKKKIYKLLESINAHIPITGKAFVDSAPVLEKVWAKEAGIGWQGKNTLLINKNLGTYFFLGELFIDIELAYDEPFTIDLCKTCRKCIDACPTNALQEGKFLDATKCISYHTIENRGEITKKNSVKPHNYIFGCDICQEVCPWNNLHKLSNTKVFSLQKENLMMTQKDWQNLTEKEFNKNFKDTELERTGLKNIKRNVSFLEGEN